MLEQLRIYDVKSGDRLVFVVSYTRNRLPFLANEMLERGIARCIEGPMTYEFFRDPAGEKTDAPEA